MQYKSLLAFDDPQFGNLHRTDYGAVLLDGAYPNSIWERNWNIKFLKERFPDIEGKTVVDMYANIGYWTLLLSKAVGPEGTVISIEPGAWNFSVLMENIRRCPWANNIVSKRCGIGPIHEKHNQPYYHNVYDANGHSLHPIREGSDDDFEHVSVTTLDHIVDDKDEVYMINFNIPKDDFFWTHPGCLNILDKHKVTRFIRDGKVYKGTEVLKQ